MEFRVLSKDLPGTSMLLERSRSWLGQDDILNDDLASRLEAGHLGFQSHNGVFVGPVGGSSGNRWHQL